MDKNTYDALQRIVHHVMKASSGAYHSQAIADDTRQVLGWMDEIEKELDE